MADDQKTAEQKAAEEKALAEKAAADKAAAEKAAGKKAGKRGDTLIVRGPQGGLRRAGRYFGPEEIEIDVSTLTEAEALAIENEPRLSSRRVAG